MKILRRRKRNTQQSMDMRRAAPFSADTYLLCHIRIASITDFIPCQLRALCIVAPPPQDALIPAARLRRFLPAGHAKIPALGGSRSPQLFAMKSSWNQMLNRHAKRCRAADLFRRTDTERRIGGNFAIALLYCCCGVIDANPATPSMLTAGVLLLHRHIFRAATPRNSRVGSLSRTGRF